MTSTWIHSFSVTDAQLYQDKFTIYGITSVIFPADQHSALSRVTIWKRYSEVKELCQKLAKWTKKERLAVQLPAVAKDRAQYFNRFSAAVIERRRQWILELLQCIGSQPLLYSCEIFTKFLQSGYTPAADSVDAVDGPLLVPTKSDSLQVGGDQWSRESDASEDPSSGSLAEDQISIVTTGSSQSAGAVARNSDCPVPSRFSADYMVEATERFNEAVQCEVNDRYAEALASYKDGLEVLMAGIRSEIDPVRRRMAKEKTQKYLSRSENIYEHFINKTPAPTAIGERVSTRELPVQQLCKYKVIRVLSDNVMSVQEVVTRRFFIIKSIDRTEDWNRGMEGGPLTYMVHLVAYFVTEFVVFLLLQPARWDRKEEFMRQIGETLIDLLICSGGRLVDYIAEFEANKDGADNSDGYCDEQLENAVAPAYESMTEDVNIDELLLSSQLLLKSVQRTLDHSNTEQTNAITAIEDETKESTETKANANRRIPEDCVRQWAKEMIVAVDALHMQHIILGHIDMHNLLLGKSGQLLLTYYSYWNCAKAISKYSYLEDGHLAQDRPIGKESDWYSVGVVLYELLTGQRYVDNHPSRWCYFELQLPDTGESQLTPAAISLLKGVSIPGCLEAVLMLNSLNYPPCSCWRKILRVDLRFPRSVHIRSSTRLIDCYPSTTTRLVLYFSTNMHSLCPRNIFYPSFRTII